MSKMNYLDLTNRQLAQFLAVYDEGAVTAAALRMNIGQSAVSHTLEKLNEIVGTPLFVRAGRGIVATRRAHSLAAEVRELLMRMELMIEPEEFFPAAFTGEVWIAASGLQRELFLPRYLKKLELACPGASIRISGSGSLDIDALRNGHMDFAVMPAPPDNTEFLQRKILEDPWVCFYDKSFPAPDGMKAFLARPHAMVVFGGNELGWIDKELVKLGKKRRVSLKVTEFSALAGLMKGRDLIVSLPASTGSTFMKGFAATELPITPEPLPYYLTWHSSQNNSPKNKWLRSLFYELACPTS